MEKENLSCKAKQQLQEHLYINSFIKTENSEIPVTSTNLDFNDWLGAVKVRWSINRDNYKVEPGLYAVGQPGQNADVFVTANYKLSFDHLRKNLDGIDAWVLVLDTKGVNVWCAAGKGTFGTDELIKRIEAAKLNEVISHRRIIAPQLGAVGIAAHKVKEATGFNVKYGPIMASDIKAFVNSSYKATDEMRQVRFNFTDRLKLLPVDIIYNTKRYLLAALAIILIVSGLDNTGVLFKNIASNGLHDVFVVAIAFLAGIAITPMLLPIVPFKSFALKGVVVGMVVAGLLAYFQQLGEHLLVMLSWGFIIVAVSSFLALSFTGSTTYTSWSGVKKEMKIAIPLHIIFAGIGLVVLVISKVLVF